MKEECNKSAQGDVNPDDRKWMEMAIELSVENVASGGGPFGAVIVKDGKVLATGVNRVVASNDPTAHAEVSAIREACRATGSFSLEGCTIYSSCEPCPMCLSAIYWARIGRLCYGNTKADAKAIGFDDSLIYDELALGDEARSIKCEHILGEEAMRGFDAWENKEDKTRY